MNFSDAEFTFVVNESMLKELALSSTSDHLSTIENKSDLKKHLINKNKKTALSYITQIENSEKALKDVHLISINLQEQMLVTKKLLRSLI